MIPKCKGSEEIINELLKNSEYIIGKGGDSMEEQQTSKKRGRKKGYKWTEEMKAKSRATWKARRECAAIVSKPQDCCVSCSDDEDRDEDNSGNR